MTDVRNIANANVNVDETFTREQSHTGDMGYKDFVEEKNA